MPLVPRILFRLERGLVDHTRFHSGDPGLRPSGEDPPVRALHDEALYCQCRFRRKHKSVGHLLTDVNYIMTTKSQLPPEAMVYFRLTGAEGGRTRARKYSKEQLAVWGKMGGRPKGRAQESKHASEKVNAKREA